MEKVQKSKRAIMLYYFLSALAGLAPFVPLLVLSHEKSVAYFFFALCISSGFLSAASDRLFIVSYSFKRALEGKTFDFFPKTDIFTKNFYFIVVLAATLDTLYVQVGRHQLDFSFWSLMEKCLLLKPWLSNFFSLAWHIFLAIAAFSLYWGISYALSYGFLTKVDASLEKNLRELAIERRPKDSVIAKTEERRLSET